MVKTSLEVEGLWRRYRRTRDAAARERLILRYLPLVKIIADRIFARLPRRVDVRDLRSAGVFGLIQAVEGFDHGRGIKFETYCSVRVRGSILDELRAQDWVPRPMRSRTSRLGVARDTLRRELGREVTETELARRLGVDARGLWNMGRESLAASLVSLSTLMEEGDGDGAARLVDLLPDESETAPPERIAVREFVDRVLALLDSQEREIVTLYYFEGLSMKEVADHLRLSESRISQVHARAVERVRSALASAAADF